MPIITYGSGGEADSFTPVSGTKTLAGFLIINSDFANAEKPFVVKDNDVEIFSIVNSASFGGQISLSNAAGSQVLSINYDGSNTAFQAVSGNAYISSSAGNIVLVPASEVDIQGVLQLDSTTVTVAAATSDITATRSYHVVNGDGAAADDLVTINGGETGDLLALTRGNADITLKHGTGNISLQGALDLVLGSGESILLLYDGTNWVNFEIL